MNGLILKLGLRPIATVFSSACPRFLAFLSWNSIVPNSIVPVLVSFYARNSIVPVLVSFYAIVPVLVSFYARRNFTALGATLQPIFAAKSAASLRGIKRAPENSSACPSFYSLTAIKIVELTPQNKSSAKSTRL